MKKHLRIALTFVAIVAAVVCFPQLFGKPPLRPGVTPENFQRLNVGMTQGQVERILGGPPGDYGPGLGLIITMGPVMRWSILVREAEWLKGQYAIVVTFDAEGKVRKRTISTAVWRPDIH